MIYDFCDQVDVMFHCAGGPNETNMEAVHVGGTTRLINSCGCNLSDGCNSAALVLMEEYGRQNNC